MINHICKVCKKEFKVHQARINRGYIVYCSKSCSFRGRHTQVTKQCKICKKEFISHISANRLFCSLPCFRLFFQGKKHFNWQGEKASYRSKHKWIIRQMGKANHCEHCGLDKMPKGMKRYFQWANISRKYRRDVLDFISLCVKCHKRYDGYGS